MVVDGSFEARQKSAWVAAGGPRDPVCSQLFCGPTKAQDGAFYAWFGGGDQAAEQTLVQSLVIPATATTLQFSLEIGDCDSASDTLLAYLDNFTVFAQPCTGPQAAQTISIDLGPLANGTLRELRFVSQWAALNGGASSFFIDDVQIGDNLPFSGAPSQCTELATACLDVEQFDLGIPAAWTVVTLAQMGMTAGVRVMMACVAVRTGRAVM